MHFWGNTPWWSRVKLRHHPALPRNVHLPKRWSQNRNHDSLSQSGATPLQLLCFQTLPCLCSPLVGFKLHEKIRRSSPGGAQSKSWSGPNARPSSAGGRIIPCHDRWPWCWGQAVCSGGSSPHNTLNQPVFPHI